MSKAHTSKEGGVFLGLMKKYTDTPPMFPASTWRSAPQVIHPLSSFIFKKTYVSLAVSIHVYEYADYVYLPVGLAADKPRIGSFYYYAKLTKFSKTEPNIGLSRGAFHTLTATNFVVFSKPTQQLFMVVYQNKPKFVFTGGLMRLVMQERKKSSKKNLKVATSLVKLSTLLLIKKNYFESGILKLNNLGTFRVRILKAFLKTRVMSKIHYILIKLTHDVHSQKWRTRRSIKKYIKKRFNK